MKKSGILIVVASVALLLAGFYRQETLQIAGGRMRIQTTRMWGQKTVAIKDIECSAIRSVEVVRDLQYLRGRLQAKYYVEIVGREQTVRLTAFAALKRKRAVRMRDDIEQGLNKGAYMKTRYVDIVLAYASPVVLLFGICIATGVIGIGNRKGVFVVTLAITVVGCNDLFNDSTVYSSRYCETTFRSINVGDDAKEIERLGEPIATFPAARDANTGRLRFHGIPSDSLVAYSYSISSNSSHYLQRILVVDTNAAIVVEKIARIYID